MQVQKYVDNIQQNENIDLNFWALAEIGKDKFAIRTFTSKYLQQKKDISPSLEFFKDTTFTYNELLYKISLSQQSPDLFIAYLILESNQDKKKQAVQRFSDQVGLPITPSVNYSGLVQALLQKKPVTPEILSNDQFHLLHFFIFFNRDLIVNNQLSTGYINDASSSWDKPGLLRTSTLDQALYRLTLFRIHYLRDQYTQTDALYRPIFDDQNFPISEWRLKIFRMLDYSMYRLGFYNRSIEIIRDHSYPLALYLNQDNLALDVRIAQGAYLYRIGNIQESKEIYLEILKRPDFENLSVSKARIYNNLAINYWKSGEFDNYLNTQFKALDESKKESNFTIQFKALRNLFTHYRINKDYNSAQDYLDLARELALEQQQNLNLAQTNYSEGLLNRDAWADYNQAIKLFDQALSLISKDDYYTSYQNISTEKASLLEKQSRFGEAKDIYSDVLKNARERDDSRNSLFAAYNIANTHLQNGQLDSTKVILDTLAIKNLDALDFYQLVKARTVQARYADHSGNPEQGAEILDPVIEQIVKRSHGSGDLETGFWQVEPEYLDAFDTYANILIDHGDPEHAVEVLDQLKTINDAALYQNPLVRSKVLNEEELSRYTRLTDDLDGLRKQLLTADEEERPSLQQQIDEKSAQKSALDRKITENANPENISVNYIQRRMNARERVLHITELNDTYYLAVISRTDVHFKKIPISEKIRSNIEETIAQTANGTTDLTRLHSITNLLKINELPSDIEKLTIIPDSYLYQLPLDILPLSPPAHSKSFGNAVYLIEKYRTNYMTSLNDFKEGSTRDDLEYNYTGFGVSDFGDRDELVALPQARAEIERISNQLNGLNHRQSFINNSATEEKFRQAAPKTRILHLATHSEVSGRDPMFSSIYLSRDVQDDESSFPGRIFAYELFELNLQNDLIMLNSCESGSGSYLQGTGVVGMSRALRYAGAQSLILNLWSVNDMLASDFAVQFYDGINKGQSKSEALRNAKLHFLKNKNANPHYWGSYMLLGNDEPVVRPDDLTKNIAVASFMTIFFGVVIASCVLEFVRRNREGLS